MVFRYDAVLARTAVGRERGGGVAAAVYEM